MILIGTPNSLGTNQQWLDCIAEWHEFCVKEGLKPWEHLTIQDLSFYVSPELQELRQGVLKAS